MKKLLSIALAVSMLMVCFVSYGSADEITANQNAAVPAINWDADYTEDIVLVVVDMEKHDYRETLTVEDFPEADITAVEEIWVGEKCQIVSLRLANPGRAEVREAVEALADNDIIESVEPNYCDYEFDSSVNDTYYNSQYAHPLTDVPEAWDYTTGSSSVKVGIVDSGIALHRDLNANLTSGWDFYNNNSNTTDDTVGHGTHVAGIVGAVTNNGEGIAGVCQNITLVPLQVDTGGEIPSQMVVDVIKYAEYNDIHILNMSFRTTSYSLALETAILTYDGLIVCSAGNDSLDNDATLKYPACYPEDNIISVASTDRYDQLASTSNYGATTVDLAAPGVGIYSTVPGTYDEKSGTSMAAPMVTGVAALLLSYNSNMTPYQIKKAILDSVDPISGLSGKVLTGGRLNAASALEMVVPGGQVRNYKAVARLSGVTDIGDMFITLNYDRSIATYAGMTDGDIIPNLGYTYADAITPNAIEYIYEGVPDPITSAGVFAEFKFDSVFKKDFAEPSFTMGYCTFTDSNGNTVNPYAYARRALMGDINSDGAVTSTDATIITNYIAGNTTLTTTQIITADTNEDGIVNVTDSIAVTRYAAGTITSFWS